MMTKDEKMKGGHMMIEDEKMKKGHMVIEDGKIIEMFFARSEQGIKELDAKYGRACYKLAYNILNNHQDAEECVNDAYLGTWNSIPPAHPSPLLTYVCKIVRNISLKLYYKNSATKRNSQYAISLEEIQACVADQNTVETEIEAKELAHYIESYLDTLTIENRVIFIRRHWFADSYNDIAKLVGLTAGNVSVRLARMSKKVKEYLADMEVYL